MPSKTFMILLIPFSGLFTDCNRSTTAPDQINSQVQNGSAFSLKPEPSTINVVRALLASRFNSLEELQTVVDIKYLHDSVIADTNQYARVQLTYYIDGQEVISELESGISQGDIIEVRDGDFWDRFGLVIDSPFAIANRMELNRIYTLARRKANLFGEGDVAFYDLAEASVKKINTPDFAYINPSDSSEKGYINTFNHVTAQAFITTLFSEELADFIADLHERHSMPELTSGNFTSEQLSEPNSNPVDNYVDMINNELGQEIGNQLKIKYGINSQTIWSGELLTDYLNDIQAYYSWTFGVGFLPFRSEEELVCRFADKVNMVMAGIPIDAK